MNDIIKIIKILFLIGIVFLNIKFGNSEDIDSTIVKKDTTSRELKNNIIQNDTLNVKMTEDLKIILPVERFLINYGLIIGTLLGAFFAGLIAVYSVRRTNKNNIDLEKKKYNSQKIIAENKYCGILFSIFSELQAHDKISINLLSEIKQFLTYFADTQNIPTDNPFSKFPLEFIKICRNKILDSQKFETTSLSLISHYINVIESVQNDLNLKRIREARIDVTDKKQLIDGMNAYFDQIVETIEKLNKLRSDLTNKIPDIIESFPQSEVSFYELYEKIKDQ